LLVLFWPVGLVLIFLTGWSQRNKVIVAVATVTVVAVASVAVASLAFVFGASRFSSSIPNDIAIMCDQPMMKPANPVHAQEKACDVELALQLAALACDSAGALPGFTLVGFDQSTGKEDATAVTNQVEAGSCNLRVRSGYSAALFSDARPTNPVTIVDFVPVSGNAGLLVATRCQDGSVGVPPCVLVRIDTDESYQCLEDRASNGPATVLAQGSFANQGYPAPTLNIGSPNRLVVQVKGAKLDAYLNTRLLCSVNVSGLSTQASVDFIVIAGTNASVTLSGFIVGEAV
jgi:hypothetical protein